jgi:SAM-dependent methyltransferase
MLLAGLRLAGDLLGAPLPPEVRVLTDDPAAAALARRARTRLVDDRRGRTGEVERAHFRLAALERRRDRLRYCLGFALAPTLEDWRALPLPDWLGAVHRLVRPLRLAAATVGLRLPSERAPFYATPLPIVERMLAAAAVGPGDLLYDLGCGDGRIVGEAARRRGARAVGVDVDPRRIAEARANARAVGVEHLVCFVRADAAAVDLSPASVVTLWTSPALNLRLRPKLLAELRPGARVVGHGFDMGDWVPTRTDLVPGSAETVVVYTWGIDRARAASEEVWLAVAGPPLGS